MSGKINVAIDGPSGAGKSTIAHRMADEFHLIYVDTGAMYRTIGLAVHRRKIDSKDTKRVIETLPDIHFELKYDSNGVQRMYLGDEDVSDEIRTPLISIYASDVSAIPQVRKFLMDSQQNLARKNDVIMDGRDIGTVVLPDAGLKIFLTAAPEARARRRFAELTAKGKDVTYEDVLRDINYRDSNDSSRAAAPLRPAEDAVRLDTTDYDFEQSCAMVADLIRERFFQ